MINYISQDININETTVKYVDVVTYLIYGQDAATGKSSIA
jgi:hypothetical protein